MIENILGDLGWGKRVNIIKHPSPRSFTIIRCLLFCSYHIVAIKTTKFLGISSISLWEVFEICDLAQVVDRFHIHSRMY